LRALGAVEDEQSPSPDQAAQL